MDSKNYEQMKILLSNLRNLTKKMKRAERANEYIQYLMAGLKNSDRSIVEDAINEHAVAEYIHMFFNEGFGEQFCKRINAMIDICLKEKKKTFSDILNVKVVTFDRGGIVMNIAFLE